MVMTPLPGHARGAALPVRGRDGLAFRPGTVYPY